MYICAFQISPSHSIRRTDDIFEIGPLSRLGLLASYRIHRTNILSCKLYNTRIPLAFALAYHPTTQALKVQFGCNVKGIQSESLAKSRVGVSMNGLGIGGKPSIYSTSLSKLPFLLLFPFSSYCFFVFSSFYSLSILLFIECRRMRNNYIRGNHF